VYSIIHNHIHGLNLLGGSTAGSSGDGLVATSAFFNSPKGIVMDTAGSFYIADMLNNRIRKVSSTTGVVSTIAGTGVAGFSGDNSYATAAQLNNPTGLTLDTNGNLYIADKNNNRIRKISVSLGIISTIAGNGTMSFFGDGSSALSASLNAPQDINVDVA